MSEPLYMLMVRVNPDAQEVTYWSAVRVTGIGRKLTRQQAETLASRTRHPARFLLRATDQREKFAKEPTAPTLAILGSESIWQYGEPTYVDMLEVLRTVMDGAASPTPDSVLLPVESVVAAAKEQFGDGDAHQIETLFDGLVMELGGRRDADSTAYCVLISRVLGLG